MLAIVLLLGMAVTAQQPSVKEDAEPMRFGMSTVLTGPTSDLGVSMRAGVLAALEERNRSGGVHGRRLELIALDDGYEPIRTAPNMRRLIEQDRVLAVVGNVGTPTAAAATPIASETRTPFVGAFTGAGLLRQSPPDRYVINLRASYAQETAAMVNALLKSGVKPDEIAFFTQGDAYGDTGFTGGVEALERVEPGVGARVAHGYYERNTLAVEGGLADVMIHSPTPKAVIMVGAYAPCAKFIHLAREVDFNASFLNVSFVGASSLARELGAEGEGVVVTQVVPHFESGLPIAEEGRQALAAINAKPDMVSIEGYAVGRMLLLAIDHIEGEVTRESIAEAFDRLGDFDLGFGVPLTISGSRRQASTAVWPSLLRNGRVESVTWEEALPSEEGLR